MTPMLVEIDSAAAKVVVAVSVIHHIGGVPTLQHPCQVTTIYILNNVEEEVFEHLYFSSMEAQDYYILRKWVLQNLFR
jgi:hypothetical protein